MIWFCTELAKGAKNAGDRIWKTALYARVISSVQNQDISCNSNLWKVHKMPVIEAVESASRPTSLVFSLWDSGQRRWPGAPGWNFEWGQGPCRRPADSCRSASRVQCWWLWREGWQEPRLQCQPRPGRRWSRRWCPSVRGWCAQPRPPSRSRWPRRSRSAPPFRCRESGGRWEPQTWSRMLDERALSLNTAMEFSLWLCGDPLRLSYFGFSFWTFITEAESVFFLGSLRENA